MIDEACQSTEPGCWIPLLRARRVVLAGDHCQLPPTVLSAEAAAEGLRRQPAGAAGRPARRRGHAAARRAVPHARGDHGRSRRASSTTATWRPTPRCAATCLRDLPGVQATPLTETPVEFIDTAGAGYDEELEPDGESRLNPQEAELVVRKVRALLEAGVPRRGHRGDRALCGPGAAAAREAARAGPGDRQRRWLPGTREGSGGPVAGALERRGRDRLPGRRPPHERGPDAARRKLLVIGDSATLAAHPFFERLFAYFDEIGAIAASGRRWSELRQAPAPARPVPSPPASASTTDTPAAPRRSSAPGCCRSATGSCPRTPAVCRCGAFR